METNFYEADDGARDMRQSLMKRKLNSSLGLFSNMTGDTRDAVNKLKQNMKLDFNSEGSKKAKITSLLASPDLNMLKLASPELEKMIIQANGMVTTTPTPTQFIFPKYVTEEQEAYARGFVDALAELHDPLTALPMPQSKNGLTAFAPTSNSLTTFSSAPVSTQGLTTTTSLPGGLSVSSASRVGKNLSENDMLLVRLKEEEPQTVPCMENTPPMSPINMEDQEIIKLERKRARNRVAARKCRTRKLERISRLEDRVKDLKGQNADLVNTATTLRDQVCKLKRQIIDHVNSGCQIMMTQNISI